MHDYYADGWDFAEYEVRDAETGSLVGSGTLDNGARGTDEICLIISGCYTLLVTSGNHPTEVSWSFGGTITGGAPYGPAQVWVDDDGALATGEGGCPTPTPTAMTVMPTPAPTLTPAPSITPAPSPIPTTSMPTAPVRIQADDFQALQDGTQVPFAIITVSVPLISIPTQIIISDAVTIFSGQNATLRANGGRHFYLESGARLRLDGLRLENGYTDECTGGGSIFGTAAYLEVFRCAFIDCEAYYNYYTSPQCDVAYGSDSYFNFVLSASGGTISLEDGCVATFHDTRFEGSSVFGSDGDAKGGTIALYSSVAEFERFRFDDSTATSENYAFSETAYGGAIYVSSSVVSFQNCDFDESAARGQSYGNVATGNTYSEAYGGVFHIQAGSSADFGNCRFIGGNASEGGAGSVDGHHPSGWSGISTATFARCYFSHCTALEYGGALMIDWDSYVDVIDCTFDENQAAYTGGVGFIHFTGSLLVSNSLFASNRAQAFGGVFYGQPIVFDSTFVDNTADYQGGVLYGYTSGSAFFNCNFSSSAAGFDGALFYTTMRTSITSSVVHGFKTPNSAFIFDHAPGIESEALSLDRVVFYDNDVAAIRSTGLVGIRNCPSLSNSDDVEVSNTLLINCSSASAGDYCSADYCADALFGIDCYCDVDGVMMDPLVGSCLTAPNIGVPERKLTILVTKPNEVQGAFFFVNTGDNDLSYALVQIGTGQHPWDVAPSVGTLSRDVAVQTLTFTLDSTRVQARAGEYTSKFSLLSNSFDEADRNVTLVTNLVVSAEPVARLSNVTLHNPSGVVAGGSLSFYLTLMDLAHIEILDAFDVAYSAMLTHPDSATTVPCSVLYDTKAERHQGGCGLPSLVCTDDDASTTTKCEPEELSPPVGGFVLEVNDTQGMLVGATRYPFTVDKCPELYYRSDAKCLLCPEHVTCSAGSMLAGWVLNPGYWRSGGTSTEVYECAFRDMSCPGGNGTNSATGPDSYCAPEYMGPLCSECAANFFISWNGDGVCYKCAAGKSHTPTIVLVCSVATIGALLVRALKKCGARKPDAPAKETDPNSFIARTEKLFLMAKIKIFTLFLASQVRRAPHGTNLMVFCVDVHHDCVCRSFHNSRLSRKERRARALTRNRPRLS